VALGTGEALAVPVAVAEEEAVEPREGLAVALELALRMAVGVGTLIVGVAVSRALRAALGVALGWAKAWVGQGVALGWKKGLRGSCGLWWPWGLSSQKKRMSARLGPASISSNKRLPKKRRPALLSLPLAPACRPWQGRLGDMRNDVSNFCEVLFMQSGKEGLSQKGTFFVALNTVPALPHYLSKSDMTCLIQI
jgi:hypothetical protein